MLEITSLSGESELLANHTGLKRNQAVNANRSLSFLLPKTSVNSHAFDLVEEEAVVTDQTTGEEYRIKALEQRVVNHTPVKSVSAPHVFFDLVDQRRYTTLTTGAKSMNELLSFIFTGTEWSFSIVDSFSTIEFENFGDDNCLALFNNVIDRFGAEYELSGRTVTIRNKIGSTVDLQFRYNHNIKTFKHSINSANLSTYIRGTGKKDSDGNPVVEAEYTSPNASIFGLRDAPPYSNESITNESTLLAAMKRVLPDAPEVTIELGFVLLKSAGYLKERPELGDIVPTIYEPLNIDLDLRVMEIEDYPGTNKAPRVTLATAKRSYAKTVMSYQKSLLDKIYDENSGRLRYNVYDEAVKRATEALNNSLTELEYPEGMGIVARDPNDPNRFVVLRSSGLGVTTDGGLTFKEAITADGVTTSLLTAGQIKTNNIQIIGNGDLFYWDGNALMAIDATDPNKYIKLTSGMLEIAKGAFKLVRPDGYTLINDGYLQTDYTVQMHYPAYYESPIEPSSFWMTTTSDSYSPWGYFNLKHQSRYLKLGIFTKTDDGASTAAVRVRDAESGALLGYGGSNSTSSGGQPETITIDLGIPTGGRRAFYLDLRSTVVGAKSYARILQAYMEG
jgi:phage minor structural protein